MSTHFKKGMLFCFIAALVVVLAACSNSNDGSDQANNNSQQATKNVAEKTSDEAASGAAQTTYPLTVSNYTTENGTWVAKEQTFDKAPERVVANTQGAAEPDDSPWFDRQTCRCSCVVW